MERTYTPIERAAIVELYIKNENSVINTQKAFREKFSGRICPNAETIRGLYEKFINTGYTQ